MAHFAQIDENGQVVQVIVVNNNELLDDNGQENEFRGVAFCRQLFGESTNWIQTSYSRKFRKNYAGIGFTYDSQRDAFIAPKPFSSWLLNESTCAWEAPNSYPNDGKLYEWDEPSTSWIEIKV